MQLIQTLSRIWRRLLNKILRKYEERQSISDYIESQLFIIRSDDVAHAFKSLDSDVKFQARTPNIEAWNDELFKINHAFSKGENLRGIVRGSGQHTVSSKVYITDIKGNYVDGSIIIPEVLANIKTLVNNFKICAGDQTPRSINSAFILEHYLGNVRETLDAWISITYGD